MKVLRDSKGRFPPLEKRGPLPESTKKKISKKLQGHLVSKETREKIRVNTPVRRGAEVKHLWKGGITPQNEKIRKSVEYKLWRESVFKRDNWTCVWCGQKGAINADHIKPFALFPELRFAIDNGRTLCVPCHKKTGSYLNRWYKI